LLTKINKELPEENSRNFLNSFKYLENGKKLLNILIDNINTNEVESIIGYVDKSLISILIESADLSFLNKNVRLSEFEKFLSCLISFKNLNSCKGFYKQVKKNFENSLDILEIDEHSCKILLKIKGEKKTK
jgi:hypothetical protein